jgi:hypothetical protein
MKGRIHLLRQMADSVDKVGEGEIKKMIQVAPTEFKNSAQDIYYKQFVPDGTHLS